MSRRVIFFGKITADFTTLQRFHFADICLALDRHEVGDWGGVMASTEMENAAALACGGRVKSSYLDRQGRECWIITDKTQEHGGTIIVPAEW